MIHSWFRIFSFKFGFQSSFARLYYMSGFFPRNSKTRIQTPEFGLIWRHRMWPSRGQKRPPFAEEPAPGQESVRDYPRSPRLIPDSRRVEVRFGELIIAASMQTYRVLETASPPAFYI